MDEDIINFIKNKYGDACTWYPVERKFIINDRVYKLPFINNLGSDLPIDDTRYGIN